MPKYDDYRRKSERSLERERYHKRSRNHRSRSHERSSRQRSKSLENHRAKSYSRKGYDLKERKNYNNHRDYISQRSKYQKDLYEKSRNNHKSHGPYHNTREERDFYNNDDGDRHRVDSDVSEEEASTIEKPNFGLTGALAEDTNTVNGVVLKYNEPQEAMKPKKQWRLYPFKDGKNLPHISIHEKSAYLFGRDRRICDIPIDHPSCSSQHAVIQFRSIQLEQPDRTMKKVVRPYLIDLDSSNGTKLNGVPIETRRYVELREKDNIKFALSSREYILLHQNSIE